MITTDPMAPTMLTSDDAALLRQAIARGMRRPQRARRGYVWVNGEHVPAVRRTDGTVWVIVPGNRTERRATHGECRSFVSAIY